MRSLVAFVAALVALLSLGVHASRAGTTGTISGTIRDAAKNTLLAGVRVTAVSASSRRSVITDGRGFFAIANLPPDSYTVSASVAGFAPMQVPGVTVVQDQSATVNLALLIQGPKTIGRTRARNSANLVQSNQTADVYNLSAQQLDAAIGGDNTHKTLYNFLQTVPGVTSTGANGQTRIRGGLATDTGYLYDDLPINDRITGFFSTNSGYFQTTPLSNVGVSSVQAYTGGFDARFGNAAQGVINSVIKRGTSPGFGSLTVAAQSPVYGHFLDAEYGVASPDNRFSAYVAFDGSSVDNQFGDGRYTFPAATQNGGVGPGPAYTSNVVGNFHYEPTQKDDIQFLYENGVTKLDANYLLAGGHPVSVSPCAGVQVDGSAAARAAAGGNPPLGGVVVGGGISATGLPCVDTSGALSNANGKSSVSNPVPTGLQFTALSPNSAFETYNYSGIGKLQWNHQYSDKLSTYLRVAEIYNEYIFNQPLTNPNLGGSIVPGTVALGQGKDPFGGVKSFTGDRRSETYVLAGEANYTPSDRAAYYVGGSLERDTNLQAYYDLEGGLSTSAYDVHGNWPNLYELVNVPLTIPTVYAGTSQRLGKFVLEPSLRFDQENYVLPRSIGGTYTSNALSPRFGFTYAARPDFVLRGSYTVTTEFVPATYVYNASVDGVKATGQTRDPYIAGSEIVPSMDHNLDFSIEKALRDNSTSVRLTPYYHKSNSRLSIYQNPLLDATGQYVRNSDGTIRFAPGSFIKTGGITQDFGIELGVNHVVAGNGLSTFFSATYQNYWATSTSLNTASISPVNASRFFLDRSLYRVSENPPISITFSADERAGRLHFLPYLLYQCCAYYNVDTADGGGNNTVKDPHVHTAPAYYFANATLSYDLEASGKKITRVGLRVQNVFSNLKQNTYPYTNQNYGRTQNGIAAGTVNDGGYFVFAPGAVPNTLYFYPPVPKTPQTFELFLTRQF